MYVNENDNDVLNILCIRKLFIGLLNQWGRWENPAQSISVPNDRDHDPASVYHYLLRTASSNIRSKENRD